jgi:hypothetical protein
MGLVRLHWGPLILDELSRALVDAGCKPDTAAARKHEALLRRSLPQAEAPTADVQAQFATVAPLMRSTKDVHVAACAHVILAHGYYPAERVVNLVTKNVRDFGVQKLAALGIAVQRPDPFLLSPFEQDPKGVASAFAALRHSLSSHPTPEKLLERLATDGQAQVAAAMLAAWKAELVKGKRRPSRRGSPPPRQLVATDAGHGWSAASRRSLGSSWPGRAEDRAGAYGLAR